MPGAISTTEPASAGTPAASNGFRPLERQILLPDRIVKQLKEMISSGELRPGDLLPAEADLARRFDVARPTIREAKKALTLIGLLDVRKGRGSYVHRDALRRLALGQIFETSHTSLLEIFEGRRLLEGSVVGLAAQRATAEDLEQMRAAVEQMELAVAAEDVAGVFDADADFHLSLARAAHNGYLFRIMAEARPMLASAVASISQVPDNIHHAVASHRVIVAAIEARDPRRAREALLRHLEASEKTIQAALA